MDHLKGMMRYNYDLFITCWLHDLFCWVILMLQSGYVLRVTSKK